MRLHVGDQMSLEPRMPLVGGRPTVRLVGWLEGTSVLVTMPQNASGRVPLQEGDEVLVRAFNGQSAFGFRTVVLRAGYTPFAYLHLGFPRNIEQVQIRSSYRTRVDLPATIAAGNKSGIAACIINIGTTGALIETAKAIEETTGALGIAVDFELHGAPVSLELQAKVRTAKRLAPKDSSERQQLGVEFKDLKPNDKLALGSLLWYRMHEYPHHAT